MTSSARPKAPAGRRSLLIDMAEHPLLIPREVLFGNPVRTMPRLSPDGCRMGYLAPDHGVLNVWVRTVGAEDDRVITADRQRGIRAYFWAEDNRHVLYVQDRDGDENWHLFAVNLDDGTTRDLTPFEATRVDDVITDRRHPDEVLVALNRRDPQAFDLHRVHLASGSIQPEAENPGHYVGWLTDHEFCVRGATAALPNGGFQLLVSRAPGQEFEPLLTWGPEDNGAALSFTADGQGLYIEDNLESDTTQLYVLNLDGRGKQVLSYRKDVDVGPVLLHPTEHHVQAVGHNLHRLEWTVLDESIREDIERLATVNPGELSLVSRDRDDRHWLMAYTADREPVRYYAYDRETRMTTFVFSNRPDLETFTLAEMRPVTIRSRDGLALYSYLTLPWGVEPKNLPLVLNVHGGPWARDSWGYDAEAQWLANRGYAVLQVNFRGSIGFGKSFLNAGNREWGAKMHDDLIDAVEWAVREGFADRRKVAIYGGSYGGYAALAGAAFTPDVFCCAVDIVGPSNIVTLIRSIPPYWAPLMHNFRVRVGDVETERDFLQARSPLFQADRMRIPLLIAQGANDPRVKQAESEQIVEALRGKGKEVEYLLFPDEGHGFARPENRMAFYAAAEQFLARNMGGRVEPPTTEGDELPGRLRK
jgi:dipeptidyl aminopeptidase/acylaminoacyl peptidase